MACLLAGRARGLNVLKRRHGVLLLVVVAFCHSRRCFSYLSLNSCEAANTSTQGFRQPQYLPGAESTMLTLHTLQPHGAVPPPTFYIDRQQGWESSTRTTPITPTTFQ